MSFFDSLGKKNSGNGDRSGVTFEEAMKQLQGNPAEMIRAAGYKVGLFTSPFINRFNERIQINGTPIPDDELEQVTDIVRPHAEALFETPTEFELITAIAFLYFLRQRCDIVVLEVGLGGTLDSTNVISVP